MSPGTVMAFVAGALFGTGLAVSGMADRHVVLAFLDVTGDFDPRLAFVMAGALAVTLPAFRWVKRLPRPRFDGSFRLPAATAIDRPLVAGAAIFGLGWGLAGYCPGPALAGLGAGLADAWLFVPAMLAGSVLCRLFERLQERAA